MTTDETFDPSKIVINPQGRLADVHGFSLNIGGQNGSVWRGRQRQRFCQRPDHNLWPRCTRHPGAIDRWLAAAWRLVDSSPLPQHPATGGAQRRRRDRQDRTAARRKNIHKWCWRLWDPGSEHRRRWRCRWGFLTRPRSSMGSAPRGLVTAGSGNGGAVSITANSASVHTTGSYAPAIFAQSVGGGGGLINFARAMVA